MPSFCTSQTKKATVILKPSGKRIIIDKNLPVNIECRNRPKLPLDTGEYTIITTIYYNPQIENPSTIQITRNNVNGEILGFRMPLSSPGLYPVGVDCLCRGVGGLQPLGWYNVSADGVSGNPDRYLGFTIDSIVKQGENLNQDNIIRITDSLGGLIAEIQNPCSFDVTCDENCKPHECEMKINQFPGYCCLDSNILIKDIREITNQLRAKK